MKATVNHILKSEFERHADSNPQYSLRAFARDLGIAAPNLCTVMKRRRGLSDLSLERVANGLRLNEKQKSHFLTLAQAEFGRSASKRKQARQKLRSWEEEGAFRALSLSAFASICDWVHFALLELTSVEGFRSEPSWIAARLRISVEAAARAMRRLIALGLVHRSDAGEWIDSQKFLATPNDIPSSALREHHRQLLEKAQRSLASDPVECRDFGSTTMAIDEGRLEEAKQAIRDFRKRFCSDLQRGTKKNRVFCFATLFFPLDAELPKGNP